MVVSHPMWVLWTKLHFSRRVANVLTTFSLALSSAFQRQPLTRLKTNEVRSFHLTLWFWNLFHALMQTTMESKMGSSVVWINFLIKITFPHYLTKHATCTWFWKTNSLYFLLLRVGLVIWNSHREMCNCSGAHETPTERCMLAQEHMGHP